MEQSVTFPSGTVQYIFRQPIAEAVASWDEKHTILITNEHIAHLYPQLFRRLKTIVLPQGEATKSLDTIARLGRELLDAGATRKTTLVGIGGGVITDIVGFAAATFMRGVRSGFVPTSLLGMVDAAIGGKNGVNVGMNKNIIGTIRQPSFILYDPRFLDTLPDDEWSNGFAEIIKYACIFDAPMFAALAAKSISDYKNGGDEAICSIIERCVPWKNKTVVEDEQEQGIRKLLNFGHTAAHAIENLYELPHGKAVAIGMVIACMVSEQVTGLDSAATGQLKDMLCRYHLPVKLRINAIKAMDLLKMDKKRNDDEIDYVVLEQIGKGAIRTLPFDIVQQALSAYDSNH